VADFTPPLLYLKERAPVPIEGRVGPSTGMDVLEKIKKVFAPTGIRIPDYPVRNLFTIPTTISRLQFLILTLKISGLGFLIRKVKLHNYELKDLLERTSNSVILGCLLS
jgi:hypothetical protein